MENKLKHIMLDIETMGDESYSSIISIGALEFDIETGETGREFYQKVDLQSCLDAGLTINASTVIWWMQQSYEARSEFYMGEASIELASALCLLTLFCNNDYQVWGNSARFDCGLISDACNKLKLQLPWDFSKERDVRTLVSFNPDIKNNFVFKGTAHNALADCYHQVGYCSEIWKSLKKS